MQVLSKPYSFIVCSSFVFSYFSLSNFQTVQTSPILIFSYQVLIQFQSYSIFLKSISFPLLSQTTLAQKQGHCQLKNILSSSSSTSLSVNPSTTRVNFLGSQHQGSSQYLSFQVFESHRQSTNSSRKMRMLILSGTEIQYTIVGSLLSRLPIVVLDRNWLYDGKKFYSRLSQRLKATGMAETRAMKKYTNTSRRRNQIKKKIPTPNSFICQLLPQYKYYSQYPSASFLRQAILSK